VSASVAAGSGFCGAGPGSGACASAQGATASARTSSIPAASRAELMGHPFDSFAAAIQRCGVASYFDDSEKLSLADLGRRGRSAAGNSSVECNRSLPGKELRSSVRRGARLPFVLGAALVAGCSGPPKIGPPPIQEPVDLAIVVHSYFGTSLTGALAAPPETPPDPAATPILHCELFLLASLSKLGPGVTPLQEEIRFVAEPERTALARGPSRLTLRGARLSGPDVAALVDLWRRGDDGNALRVADVRRPLPRATACSVLAQRSEGVEDPDDFLGERAELGRMGKHFGAAIELRTPDAAPDAAAATPPDAAHVTLDLLETVRSTSRERADRVPAGDGGEDWDRYAALELRHELVRLTVSVAAGGGPLVVVVPSPFRDEPRDGRPAFACAICIELLPAPKEGDEAAAHAEEVAKVWKEAQEQAELVASQTALHAPEDVVALALRRALETLVPEASSRATMVYMTTATDASFAADLALVASDAELAEWLHKIVDHPHDPPGASVAAFGWYIERSAWHHVIAQMLASDPPPEIEATMLRHAGAVGRLATTLEDIVDSSSDIASLERRFVAENLAALADSSASSRVRAYDWLATRSLAPAGYDPLAPSEARRTALEGAEPRRE